MVELQGNDIMTHSDIRLFLNRKVVHLILKFKWFDLIASGKKRVEYRRNCEFWRKRLEGKEFVTLHRGYTKNTMTFKIARKKTVKGIIEIHLACMPFRKRVRVSYTHLR